MTTSDCIQLAVLIITAIALIITLLHNKKQLELFNKQLKLNFFTDYTKRYQEIILNFPENINQPDFDINKLVDNERNKTMRYMRVYFDLCSEEFDLWKSNNIEPRIWKNWKSGIEFALGKRAFKEAWILIKKDTIYYPDFSKWIDGIVDKKDKQ